jgi:hypothetical protein
MTVSVEAFFFTASELTIFFLNFQTDHEIIQFYKIKDFKKTDKDQKEIFFLCQLI